MSDRFQQRFFGFFIKRHFKNPGISRKFSLVKIFKVQAILGTCVFTSVFEAISVFPKKIITHKRIFNYKKTPQSGQDHASKKFSLNTYNCLN